MKEELEGIKELFRSENIVNHKLGLQLGLGLGMSVREIIKTVLNDGKGWVIKPYDNSTKYCSDDYIKTIFDYKIYTCFYEVRKDYIDLLFKIDGCSPNYNYYSTEKENIILDFNDLIDKITEEHG